MVYLGTCRGFHITQCLEFRKSTIPWPNSPSPNPIRLCSQVQISQLLPDISCLEQRGASKSPTTSPKRKRLLEKEYCFMSPSIFFSRSIDVELARIHPPLRSKAICMHHGDKIVIKVRVLEATQTAEPILHVSPCVSRHAESHLELKDRKAFQALRRPVLRSRCFHLRLS